MASYQELGCALAEVDPQYDAAAQMIRRPLSSPGYHATLTGGSVHPTRDTPRRRLTMIIPERPGPLAHVQGLAEGMDDA